MLVVGWQLWQLRRNLKAGVFGSRLAVRLVLLFALVAGLPGALVYAVSAQFIGRSIESWFDVRVDRALDSGLTLADSSLKYLLNDTTNKATQLAVALSDTPGNLSMALNRAAEQANVFEATLFTPTGGVLAVAGTGGSRATPEPPPPEALRLARLQQAYKKIEDTGEGGLALRVVVPVNTDDIGQPAQVAAGDRARTQGIGAGSRTRTLRRSRLPRTDAAAAGLEAALPADAPADASAGADDGARSRGGSVRAIRGTARASRRGHARGGGRRFHAAATGRLAR